MLSNYVSAAIRSFMRNRAYSTIVTLSLAVGFAAMMLAAIYWRYEHSYDSFWPNGDRIYLVAAKTDGMNGPRGDAVWGWPPSFVGPQIGQTAPGVEAVSRLRFEPRQLVTAQTEVKAWVAWADRNFFQFFPPKLVAGDLTAALRPGSAVLTRSAAEKYYGRPDVVGESLTLERLNGSAGLTAARIGAVIEDWPANSHLAADVLLGWTETPAAEAEVAVTYLKLREGVSEESLRRSLETVSRQLPPAKLGDTSYPRQLLARPLRFAYMPSKEHGRVFGVKSGTPGLPKVFVGLGALMLVVSAINFINLMTARGGGRAMEVGIRKVVGARRRDLVTQFVGEGLLYAGFAFVLALALVEIAAPLITSMTGQPLPFVYSKSLGLIGMFALGAVVIGAAASLYPALMLSSIRPVRAMRNDFTALAGSPRLRQWLVVLQFVPLLLLAGGGLAFRGQDQTVLHNSLKMIPADGVVLREPCNVALKAQLAAIPGVASVACLEMEGFLTSAGFNGVFRDIGAMTSTDILDRSGKRSRIDVRRTDREALAYYDTEVIAGKLWPSAEAQRGLVLNEDAARLLGYDPNSAIGQEVTLRQTETREISTHPVIGVVRNRAGIANARPAAYLNAAPAAERKGLVAGIRLSADADPVTTTAAIDKMFKTSTGRMPRRAFDRDELLESRTQERQILQWLGACVGVGLLMAAAGIFAMAVFLANLRTREIGIRKAFGASRFNLLRILVFQFTKPVLIANLIAIPLVITFAYSMARKTPMDERFALTLSAFAPVFIGSLAITVLATFSQAWRVTGQLPLKALRSE